MSVTTGVQGTIYSSDVDFSRHNDDNFLYAADGLTCVMTFIPSLCCVAMIKVISSVVSTPSDIHQ